MVGMSINGAEGAAMGDSSSIGSTGADAVSMGWFCSDGRLCLILRVCSLVAPKEDWKSSSVRSMRSRPETAK